MADSYIVGPTIDDLMRKVVEAIRSRGEPIAPSRGPAAEIVGVLLELENPRARLSRTEKRGKLFSCLGELCWYLAESDDLPFIEYYITKYKEEATENKLLGAYGPRLFGGGDNSQVSTITTILREKPDSRQAVIQLFDAQDLSRAKDVPCTTTLQFFLRKGRLHLLASMRSNDAYLGLTHDVFCFTMLQEVLARQIGAEIGTYKHVVGSLHLYDEHKKQTDQFMDEGWQSTDRPMPPMPEGDPWSAIRQVLKAEAAIRQDQPLPEEEIETLHPYWQDFVRLLQVFRLKKDSRRQGILDLRQRLSSTVYHAMIDKVIADL
jgi:thymidylate synthase